MVGPFWPLVFGLDLAHWQNVGLATLIRAVESRLRTRATVQPLWE